MSSTDDLEALAGLADPARRRLYDLVAASPRPVGRAEAAEAAGISRTLAAFHLDKLVEAGLLDSGFQPPVKKGPGSGRPAKVYTRARRERAVSLPPRDYVTLAAVLAETVELLDAQDKAEQAARKAGEKLAAGGGDLLETLRERGYEPYAEGEQIRLRNCPFHTLAEEQPVLVCSLNLALCQGLLQGLGQDPARASLDPRPGECCVAVSKTNKN
ncbi:helix-turn-helix transcriptional regulator [Nonomuraea sp. NPDC050663]|uniref:helix-turn-helix transcriptional regulator n=1 Tax=Nonomuraea sp. NPDC050663 TaxID=3364370 RepID=UPI0037AD1230